MAEKFELGQKVNVKAKVIAVKDFALNRKWKRYERKYTGIIVGVRTVKEGYSEYIGHEEGYAFVPTEHIKVYLVAVNMRNFIRALPEDIEVTGDES